MTRQHADPTYPHVAFRAVGIDPCVWSCSWWVVVLSGAVRRACVHYSVNCGHVRRRLTPAHILYVDILGCSGSALYSRVGFVQTITCRPSGAYSRGARPARRYTGCATDTAGETARSAACQAARPQRRPGGCAAGTGEKFEKYAKRRAVPPLQWSSASVYGTAGTVNVLCTAVQRPQDDRRDCATVTSKTRSRALTLGVATNSTRTKSAGCTPGTKNPPPSCPNR